MKAFAIFVCALLASTSLVGAQSGSPARPAITMLQPVIGPRGNEQVQMVGLVPSATLTALVIDPTGEEQALSVNSDASGSASLALTPPDAGWRFGLYRIAVSLPNNAAMSATFAVSDGQQRLQANPYLPSPTSALLFTGMGFTPGATISLTLYLTGGQQGAHDIPVTVDAAGTFSVLVWPQQFGLPFFAAGDYRVASDDGLSTPFRVREHPVSAAIAVSTPVASDRLSPVHFQNYQPHRFLWGLYATLDGHLAGEFLVGQTDAGGRVDASLDFGGLAPGRYLLATPYDWGETSFDVPDPTPTVTASPTPAVTATPDPAVTATRRCTHKKRCRHKRKRRPNPLRR
jgi:hypothetical protein